MRRVASWPPETRMLGAAGDAQGNAARWPATRRATLHEHTYVPDPGATGRNSGRARAHTLASRTPPALYPLSHRARVPLRRRARIVLDAALASRSPPHLRRARRHTSAGDNITSIDGDGVDRRSRSTASEPARQTEPAQRQARPAQARGRVRCKRGALIDDKAAPVRLGARGV